MKLWKKAATYMVITIILQAIAGVVVRDVDLVDRVGYMIIGAIMACLFMLFFPNKD